MPPNHLHRSGWLYALIGALLLASASTAGDWIWDYWSVRHTAVAGLIHGALLFLLLGVYLGWLGGSRSALIRGVLGGPAAGLLAALSFYALAPFLRMSAMFVSWVFLWILLGLLANRTLPSPEPGARALSRGVAAALLSGIAFYAISGIWFDHSQPPDYLYNFVCWLIAYAPAFVSLLLLRKF